VQIPAFGAQLLERLVEFQRERSGATKFSTTCDLLSPLTASLASDSEDSSKSRATWLAASVSVWSSIVWACARSVPVPAMSCAIAPDKS
jgi:hypothetical protein